MSLNTVSPIPRLTRYMNHFSYHFPIFMSQFLPKTRWADKFYALISFILNHKRFPRNQFVFNDMLYKIKTSDEILNPLRIFVSDKEFVKDYVKAKLGDKYNVPTFAVLKSAEEIDSYQFPEKCCIKPTHASGKVILRKNNEPIDREEIKKWLSINYYLTGREVNYKSLQPKIIVEPLIFENSNVDDFKFFCYNGVVKLIQVDCDRYTNHKRVIFDKSWIAQDYSIIYEKAEKTPEKPSNLAEMIEVAETLAANFGFVRVDLYSNGKDCLLGEITNCHGNASENFIPSSGEITASKTIFS